VRSIETHIGSRHILGFAAAALFVFLPATPLFAQSSEIADRLPPATFAYMCWRGTAYIAAGEQKNHILQLIEDPDFAPLRQRAMDDFRKGMEKQGVADKMPTLPEIISLLDNPMAAGAMLTSSLPGASKTDSAAPSPPIGFFFLYDTTGKTALIDLLRTNPKLKEKEARAVLDYDFEGIKVEGRSSGTTVSYTARAGHYFIMADQKPVIEELIRRFQGAAKPASSLTQVAGFKEMRPYIGSDAAIELFAYNPGVEKLIPRGQMDKIGAVLVDAVHLEKIHAIGVGISFAQEATRFRGAVLGDTTPPSLFEAAGESTAALLTAPYVDGGPFFSISKFDLSALYRLIRGGFATAAAQNGADISTVEAMAKNFLGMSVDDALRLFTGEIGSRTSYSDDGEWQKSFAIGIQKQPEVLRLLRTAVGSYISDEKTEGDITFLEISAASKGPAGGTSNRPLYYVAVTPQMIYASPQKATLRETLVAVKARSADSRAANGTTIQDWNQLRAHLPEKLSGMSGADLSKLSWEKYILRYRLQVMEATKDSNSAAADYFNLLKPEVFFRHLHAAISGWWKDSSGVYFDSYIQ
jgi:hypothetical protein